jgi:hypothetical protein
MDIDNKPICAEVRSIECVVPQSKGKEEPVLKNDQKKPILPLALRETEIDDADVEVMLRVARDKKAISGRYKRTPKRLPKAELVVAQK